jgi:hypothetical protein
MRAVLRCCGCGRASSRGELITRMADEALKRSKASRAARQDDA